MFVLQRSSTVQSELSAVCIDMFITVLSSAFLSHLCLSEDNFWGEKHGSPLNLPGFEALANDGACGFAHCHTSVTTFYKYSVRYSTNFYRVNFWQVEFDRFAQEKLGNPNRFATFANISLGNPEVCAVLPYSAKFCAVL